MRVSNRDIAALVGLNRAKGYISGGERRNEPLYLTENGRILTDWYANGHVLVDSIAASRRIW